MTFKHTSFLWLWVLAMWIALVTHGFTQTAKIAVLGDPSLRDLVDMTTAQISTLPDVEVQERSDLTKIGHEEALQSILATNDLSSVRADGLVILRAVQHDGKTGVFARLVAVQPGIVLREVALSDGANPAAHAAEIVQEFTPYWAKLGRIKKGRITALSLLGLRFELDGPQTREMERQINLLLR